MRKIIFVLSLLALTGSVLTSCSKDREEVTHQENKESKGKEEDNAITKENLVASGKFVEVGTVILDEKGKVKFIKIPGKDGVYNYNAFLFRNDGTYTLFHQNKLQDKVEEINSKYKMEGNKITIYDSYNEETVYEVVEFVKGEYLKLKTENIEKDILGNQNKTITISEFKINP